MRATLNKIYGILACPLALIYWIIILGKTRKVFNDDLRQWTKWKRVPCNLWGFSYLLGCMPEYRTVFYKRLRFLKVISCWWLRGKSNLEISTNDIGGGLLIQHGIATIISAEKIGENCKIYQQVTIGFTHDMKAPVIGNNVEICCGAKVLGGITIGDNVLIGANAVVIKDVPSNSVVAGVPAKVIKTLNETRDLTL